MTHRLISINQAAERLGISLDLLEEYIRRGWLTPDVPSTPAYFDAKRVEQFKKRLPGLQKKSGLNWSLIAAIAALAAIIWFLSPRGREDRTAGCDLERRDGLWRSA
jgi:transposase